MVLYLNLTDNNHLEQVIDNLIVKKIILRSQLHESRFFQNCGSFNANQNKKYNNFETRFAEQSS